MFLVALSVERFYLQNRYFGCQDHDVHMTKSELSTLFSII